jgi:rare lipoprotein A (peptidoglycan hydrolase)
LKSLLLLTLALPLLLTVGGGCRRRVPVPAPPAPGKPVAAVSKADETSHPEEKEHRAPPPVDFEVNAVSARNGEATWYEVPENSLPKRRAWTQEMTAASDSLPMDSYARVTREDNGKNVIVRITDKGIHRKGAIIDLNKDAAGALGMVEAGKARVRVEKLALKNVSAEKPVEPKAVPAVSKINAPAASKEEEKQAAEAKTGERQ